MNWYVPNPMLTACKTEFSGGRKDTQDTAKRFRTSLTSGKTEHPALRKPAYATLGRLFYYIRPIWSKICTNSPFIIWCHCYQFLNFWYAFPEFRDLPTYDTIDYKRLKTSYVAFTIVLGERIHSAYVIKTSRTPPLGRGGRRCGSRLLSSSHHLSR